LGGREEVTPVPSEHELEGDAGFADSSDSFSIEPQVMSSRPLSIGPGVYTLAREALLLSMTNPTSGWIHPPWKMFLTGSTRTSTAATRVRTKASWRADMADFVLELMRRRVVEGLVYLVQRKRGYVAGCIDWDDAKMPKRQPKALLLTGKLGDGVDETLETVKAVDVEAESLNDEDGSRSLLANDEPPLFATLMVGKDKPHMVPVHNLQILLGSKHLEDLRKKCHIFNKEVLIIRDKRVAVDVLMKLWKLQGYLAFPEIATVGDSGIERSPRGRQIPS